MAIKNESLFDEIQKVTYDEIGNLEDFKEFRSAVFIDIVAEIDREGSISKKRALQLLLEEKKRYVNAA